MKKVYFLIFIGLTAVGCDTEKVPDCLKSEGASVTEEFAVTAFDEIMVYEQVKLFIEQGAEYKVVVETGANLIDGVVVEVDNNRLSIRNTNTCNLFRDYEVTRVFVTTPSLTWLQNSSGSAIESIGTLKFDHLWLRSFNQEKDPGIHTDGDFILDLEVGNLRITNDNVSNYFLSGRAENLNAFFAAGDGRLEAADLIVQHCDIFHRGTNKMILNPRQSIKGEIRSLGDVIAKNRPPMVRVETFYTGRLIFEEGP